MDPSKWFKLDENSRTDHLHRLRNAARKLGSKDKHVSVSTSTFGGSSISRREELTTIDWSLYAQLPKCTSLPENIMNGILRRAEELVTADNAITTAPVEGTTRAVKTKSNPSYPHLACTGLPRWQSDM